MKAPAKNSKRNSWIELLRILCMFLIIAAHCSSHSGFAFDRAFSLGKVGVQSLTLGGSASVTLFVLISGYYTCDMKFRLKSLVKLIAEVWFYTVVIALALTVTGLSSPAQAGVSWKSLLLPTLTGLYWFPTVYTMLYLVSPFLNMLIRAMNQRQHLSLIAVLLLIWSALYMLTFEVFNETMAGWFCLLYLIAAYVKHYPPKPASACRHFLRAAGWLIFSPISIVLINLVYAFTGQGGRYVITYTDFYSLFVVFGALEIFLGFLQLKPWHCGLINTISSTCFGIYLIHDHPMIRHLLWRGLFKGTEFYHSPLLIPYALGCALAVFIVCVAVDLVRQHTVERAFFLLIDRKNDRETRIQAFGSRLMDKALRRIHG